MKKILNIFKLLVLSAMLLVGCQEHLDVDTYNNITGASYWKVPGDAVAYANGIQARLMSTLDGNDNYVGITDARTDMFRPGGLGPRFTGPIQLHTQTGIIGGGNWSGYYNLLHHCNLLLVKIEEIEFDDAAEKNAALAVAYFTRAFIYFDLVRIYGDVPLVLEPTLGKPELENYYARAPKTEVLTSVKADVDLAISLLPSGIADKNFISKPAALALKAEVYMWTARAYSKSAVTADLDIAIAAIDAIPGESGGSVSYVTSDWKSIFKRQANDCPEYIWANFFDYLVGPKNNLHDAITLRIDNVPIPMQGTFPIAVTDEGLNRIEIGSNMNNIYRKYETVEAHDDPFDKTDVPPYTDKRDLRYINSMVDANGDGSTNVCIKFPGILVSTDNRRYWDNDLPIYRWTGMLLLKAEALLAKGQTNPMIDILNMTRTRAGLAEYSGATDTETLENELLDEIAREMLAENQRWWSLIRAHKVGRNVPRFMDNRGDDYSDPSVWDFYYWPLDESVLIKNDKLVQSPGFTN